MSFLDEAPSGFAQKFPFPEGADPEPETLEPEQKWSVTAPCKEWRLINLRANSGIGDKGKTVVNVTAKGLADEYNFEGEVAYWFDPKQLDNPKHPIRRDAAMLGKLMVALGLLAEDDFAGKLTGADICALLVRGASAYTPKATFSASLVWSKRAYKGNDGNTYHAREIGFRSIGNVTALEEQSSSAASNNLEDLPF